MTRPPAAEVPSYVKDFGRHPKYADGQQTRPLCRGYVHFLALVLAAMARAMGYHMWLPARARLFVQCTLLSYLCSVCLHMVPWKTRLGYDVSLALDFVGISWGFTSHTVLWSGGMTTFSALGAATTFACMCAMQIAAFTQKSKNVISFMRRRRLALIGLNILFLAVIETTSIVDFKLMLIVQILSKIVAPLYFMACTRYDAKHNAIFEIAGVWGPHENWHVLILIVHLLQLKALIDQNS